MPRIERFGAKVAIYIHAVPREHPPPHFHIVGPEFDVAVEIRTPRIMEGRYRPQDLAEALDWAAVNIEGLLAHWERINERD